MKPRYTADGLMNTVNVLILLVIVLLYVVTGTGLGDDAIGALSDETVYRGNPSEAVALECIVSWDASAIDQMLDTCRETDTKITFFVSGQWAKEHADTLHRMAADGHEIGSCGYTPTMDGDESFILSDIKASKGVIESITGSPVAYYHAGLRDKVPSQKAAEQLNLTHVACTSDLLSARGEAADIALRASKQAFDGSILMIQPTGEAARALPAIFAELEEAGLAVKTVGAILE